MMLKKILLILLMFTSILFSKALNTTQQNLYKEIETEFSRDFDVWGVEFNKDLFFIRFTKNELLYQSGQVEISEAFKIILKDFYPRYINILIKYKDIIDRNIIKCHTSSENSKGRTEQEK